MKYIKSYENFINEEIETSKKWASEMNPLAKIQDAIQAGQTKIAQLKQEMKDKPEMANFTAAKIRLEMEKIDVLMANKALAVAKERDEDRKAREAAAKERGK